MGSEDDPRQMSFEDEIRRRREDAIRASKGAARPPVATPTPRSPTAVDTDRSRAFSRWKTGWLAWHENGMDGDRYEALYG